jgi:hypothetical protein
MGQVVCLTDASEFEADLEIRGEERFGYRVLTVSSTAVADGIAAICLAMRDQFGLMPRSTSTGPRAARWSTSCASSCGVPAR